jgi:hypothetical protein
MDSGMERTARRVDSEERLNAAIDMVAREMTESEPSAALRARILNAVEQGRRYHAPVVPRWAWMGVAAAIALAAATTVWINRPLPAPEDASTRAAQQRAAVPVPQAAAQMALSPQPGSRPGESPATPANQTAPGGAGTARVVADRRGRPAPKAAGRAADDFAALVPALAEITPLAFSQVEPVPLDVRGVEVTPLDIAPIPDIPILEPGSTDRRSSDPNKERQP